MSGNQALLARSSKEHTADRINSHDLRRQMMLAHILGTPTHRSTGARSAKQIVKLSIQLRNDLVHGPAMSFGVVKISVLIGPKAIRDCAQLVFRPVETS